jgi:HEAT repeat protein
MRKLGLELIVDHLRHEETRWDAILELKLFQDKKEIPTLISLLKDSDWVIRWCIAEKLGDLGDASALPDLAKLLADPDQHVRKNVQKAIQKFQARAIPIIAPYLHHRHIEVRKSVYYLIYNLQESAIPAIEKVVFAHGKIVASRLIHILWAIGGPLAEKSLIRLLDVPALQKQLILLLGNMKVQAAFPRLISLYGISRLKKTTLFAFRCIGEAPFFEFIIRTLLHGSKENQERAEEVIQKVGKHILQSLVNTLHTEPHHTEKLLDIIEKISAADALELLSKQKASNPNVAKLIKAFIQHHHKSLPSTQKEKGFFGFLDEFF